MASIQKRGNTYRVRIIRRGYPTLSHTFTTRREAEKWARKAESDIDQGEIKPRVARAERCTNDITFKNAAEHYAATHTPLKRNHRSEAGIIRILIDHFGERTVSEIDAPEVAALRDQMIKQGRSGTTIGHYFNAISVIYQMLADEWGPILSNPTKGVKRPPQNPPRQIRLSEEAKVLLLNACAECSERLLEPIVRLALETGMRRGELMSLTWADIDFGKRRITIKRSKNGRSRVIPASSTSVSILRALAKNNDDRLFPIDVESMRKHFERSLRRAAERWTADAPNPLKELRFHDLRHEALSQLSDRGLNVIELSQFSGHRTLAMLARYTHPDTEIILRKLDIQTP